MLSSSYKPWIKAKAFCLYNKRDYNALVIKQKNRLLRHHAKEIEMIVKQQSFVFNLFRHHVKEIKLDATSFMI